MAGGRAKLQWRRPKTCPTGETRAFDEKGHVYPLCCEIEPCFLERSSASFVGCQYVTLMVDHAAVSIRRNLGYL